jgi:hypothetical protein
MARFRDISDRKTRILGGLRFAFPNVRTMIADARRKSRKSAACTLDTASLCSGHPGRARSGCCRRTLLRHDLETGAFESVAIIGDVFVGADPHKMRAAFLAFIDGCPLPAGGVAADGKLSRVGE